MQAAKLTVGVGGREGLLSGGWDMGDGTGGGCGGSGTPTDAAECGDAIAGNPVLWAGEATPPPPLGLANDPGRELIMGIPVTL